MKKDVGLLVNTNEKLCIFPVEVLLDFKTN